MHPRHTLLNLQSKHLGKFTYRYSYPSPRGSQQDFVKGSKIT